MGRGRGSYLTEHWRNQTFRSWNLSPFTSALKGVFLLLSEAAFKRGRSQDFAKSEADVAIQIPQTTVWESDAKFCLGMAENGKIQHLFFLTSIIIKMLIADDSLV